MFEKIKHNESSSIKVRKFLVLMGFYPANYNGVELEHTINGVELEHTISDRLLGVLCSNPNAKLKKKRWFGLASQKRRVFLGLIWFENKPRSANIDNWVFEVYEEKHIELAKELANDMSLFFDKKVTVYSVNKKFAY